MCGIEEDMTFIEIKSSASNDIIRATMLINSAERDNWICQAKKCFVAN